VMQHEVRSLCLLNNKLRYFSSLGRVLLFEKVFNCVEVAFATSALTCVIHRL
jgi:hypothetical protein